MEEEYNDWRKVLQAMPLEEGEEPLDDSWLAFMEMRRLAKVKDSVQPQEEHRSPLSILSPHRRALRAAV